DPDAVVRVARIATDFRHQFATDVVVDVVGYRKHGHSEVDDPTITQPRLYAAIERMPPLWRSYAEKSGAQPDSNIDSAWLEGVVQQVQAELDAAHARAGAMEKKPRLATLPDYWNDYRGGFWEPALEVDTGVEAGELARIGDAIGAAPEGFHVHPKVSKLLEQRREMGRGSRPVDYGMAEALAFGSLLTQGVPLRLTGQDTRRGTFNQRHSVLIDVENEQEAI